MRPRTARATLVLVLGLVVAGVPAVVGAARLAETHRRGLEAAAGPALFPLPARVVPAGFGGVAADWYWLRTLQYLGRALEGGRVALDRGGAQVDAPLLHALLDRTVTFDPDFRPAYEFGAVVLADADAEAALALIAKGLARSPDSVALYQQLAWVHWQRADLARAAAAFREGARRTSAGWMEALAARLDAEGGDRELARGMYAGMAAQAEDPAVREWARQRLRQLQAFEERERLGEVLLAAWRRRGTCPGRWRDVAAELPATGVALAADGTPLDPEGTPYVLGLGGCAALLSPDSPVPRY